MLAIVDNNYLELIFAVCNCQVPGGCVAKPTSPGVIFHCNYDHSNLRHTYSSERIVLGY